MLVWLPEPPPHPSLSPSLSLPLPPCTVLVGYLLLCCPFCVGGEMLRRVMVVGLF